MNKSKRTGSSNVGGSTRRIVSSTKSRNKKLLTQKKLEDEEGDFMVLNENDIEKKID